MPWTREDVDQTMMVISQTITADASGDVAAVVTAHELFGMVVQIHTAAGGTAPTDLWDLTIVDDTGSDCTGGAGANITSAGNPHTFFQSADLENGVAVDGLLTMTAANMGNGGIATVTLYIVRMGL